MIDVTEMPEGLNAEKAISHLRDIFSTSCDLALSDGVETFDKGTFLWKHI